MDEHISNDIYVLERVSSGEIQCIDIFPLSAFLGAVPVIGDRITLDIYHDDQEGDGIAITEVVGRHFVRYIAEISGVECYAWFVLVKTIEADDAVELASAFGEVFRREFRDLWRTPRTPPPTCAPIPPPPYPKSKRASRKNKDPDYWTPERKEELRKKREARVATRSLGGLSEPYRKFIRRLAGFTNYANMSSLDFTQPMADDLLDAGIIETANGDRTSRVVRLTNEGRRIADLIISLDRP